MSPNPDSTKSEALYAPKGDVSARAQALRCLGRFQFKTKAEFKRHFKPSPDKKVPPYIDSYERAKERVDWLARSFNEWSALEKDYPRVAATLRDLDRLLECVDALCNAIQGTHWSTWDRVHAAGTPELDYVSATGWGMKASESELECYTLAQSSGFPPGRYSKLEPSSGPTWLSRLEALDQWLALTRRNFVASFGSGKPGKPDAGGATTLFDQFGGTAKWRLAKAGYEIFESCRPGQASKTEYGDFHKFLIAVAQYATGNEHQAGILDHARRVIDLHKRIREVSLRQAEVNEAVLQIPDPPRAPESQGDDDAAVRKWRLKQELAELNRRDIQLTEAYLSNAAWRPSRKHGWPTTRPTRRKRNVAASKRR